VTAPLLTVAHRAGNSVAGIRAALAAGVDLMEADVHLFRRAIEVRHTKTLGPALLWDRWELARRRDAVVPELTEVLAAFGDASARLMLDLKGLRRGLAPAVAAALRAAVPGAPVTICTRHWWMLAAFADDPHVRLVLSAGSRRGLRRLRAAAGRPGAAVFGACVRRELLTPAVVAELRGTVGHVLPWPVDTPAQLADARRLGVTGVVSKNLDLLRGLISK
jgi:glycerophosphoryl diester phosphodiesterase